MDWPQKTAWTSNSCTCGYPRATNYPVRKAAGSNCRILCRSPGDRASPLSILTFIVKMIGDDSLTNHCNLDIIPSSADDSSNDWNQFGNKTSLSNFDAQPFCEPPL